jgi:hypothetical protein
LEELKAERFEALDIPRLGHRKHVVACSKSMPKLEERKRKIYVSKSTKTKRGGVRVVKVGCAVESVHHDYIDLEICSHCGNEYEVGTLCTCDSIVVSIPLPEAIEHNLQ